MTCCFLESDFSRKAQPTPSAGQCSTNPVSKKLKNFFSVLCSCREPMTAVLSFLLAVGMGRDGMQISSKLSDGSLGTLKNRQLLRPHGPTLVASGSLSVLQAGAPLPSAQPRAGFQCPEEHGPVNSACGGHRKARVLLVHLPTAGPVLPRNTPAYFSAILTPGPISALNSGQQPAVLWLSCSARETQKKVCILNMEPTVSCSCSNYWTCALTTEALLEVTPLLCSSVK